MGQRSRARAARSLVAALLAALGALGGSGALAAPPSPQGGCCTTKTTCWDVAGTVQDFYARALGGARVSAEEEPCPGSSATTTTDSAGRYLLRLMGTVLSTEAPATASKDGYVSARQTVFSGTCTVVGGACGNNTFSLLFAVTASLSPVAMPSPGPISAQGRSLAPASGTPRVQMIAQDASATRADLSPGDADPLGWTSWTGTYTPAPGTQNGRYTLTFCAVDRSFAGNCDEAAQAVPPAIASNLLSVLFWIDDVAPAVQALSPQADHDTVTRRPAIVARATDGLSGVDPPSVSVTLDGNVVAPVYDPASGLVSYTPPAALALGVHSVTVAGRDHAGNAATLGWSFDVIAITSSASTGRVPLFRVGVNPGGAIPPPASVTFSGVPATLDPVDVTLSSSSLWAGAGVLSIAAMFWDLQVTFSNELGQSATVPAPEVPAAFRFGIGVLEPQVEPLGVNIPQMSAILPEFTVSVPSGFVATRGSTAAVSGVQAVVAAPVPQGGGPDPLAVQPDCSTSPCTVKGAVTCTIASPGPEYSCKDGTFPRATMDRTIDGMGINVTSILSDVNYRQGSSTYRKRPEPNPAKSPNCGTSFSCQNLLDIFFPPARLEAYWGTGQLFRAFGNEYFFGISRGEASQPERIAVLQAADAAPGAAGCAATNLLEFGNAVESTSDWQTSGPAYAAGTAGVGGQVFDRSAQDIGPIVRREPGGALVYSAGFADPDNINNLDLRSVLSTASLTLNELGGSYASVPDGSVDMDGNLTTAPGKATRNIWTPNPGDRSVDYFDYTTRPAEVMTATEFSPQDPEAAWGFRAVLYFTFAFRANGAC